MTVTLKRKLTHPTERIDTDTQGSLQAVDGRADGNMLLGYGSWPTVREFNAEGDVIWTARFGPSAPPQIASYRAFKSNWHATPWYPPALKAVAYQSPTFRMSTHFYVSWNGATDVARWDFYAQTSFNSTPVVIGSVPKKEFETPLILEGYLDRVSVQAIHVNGDALPRSPVQRTEKHGDWSGPNKKIPTPDDPSKIIPTIINSTTDVISDHVENTLNNGSNSDEEEHVKIVHPEIIDEYHVLSWALLIIWPLVGITLVSIWLCWRHREQAWNGLIPGPKEV
jgi:hypothetical protein